jgi:hypothetical protein
MQIRSAKSCNHIYGQILLLSGDVPQRITELTARRIQAADEKAALGKFASPSSPKLTVSHSYMARVNDALKVNYPHNTNSILSGK